MDQAAQPQFDAPPYEGPPPRPPPPMGAGSALQMASNMNLDALKEPRGFIKVIQFILAIFAFATTTSHSTSSSFTVPCQPDQSVTQRVVYKYGYAYDLGGSSASYTCGDETYSVQPWGNFNAPSQFYVFVGVMAFLYSLAAIVLYVWFDDKYRSNENVPVADFVVTAVFALLWLISSSAWASGVTDVKYYSDPNEWHKRGHIEGCVLGNCSISEVSTGNFASLNVSIIFGFLNMCVWGANLWFLFKETKWFRGNAASMGDQQHLPQQAQQGPPMGQGGYAQDQPQRPPGQPGYI